MNKWDGTVAELLDYMFDPTMTFEDLKWIRNQWKGTLTVKGIQTVQDAKRCAKYGVDAVLLSLCPKFGAILSLTPIGVLGGVGLVLYGMIAVLGAKIWIESKVNFGITQNLMVVAATLIIGVSDMSWTHGNYTFTGIVNGTLVAVIGYRVFNGLAKMVGNPAE
jgi:xanthine/uracil permease